MQNVNTYFANFACALHIQNSFHLLMANNMVVDEGSKLYRTDRSDSSTKLR